MASAPVSADVRVTIKDRALTLRFSAKAWAALCAKWGCESIAAAQTRLTLISETMKIDDIVDVFWASMQSHHAEITPAEAFDLADEAGINELGEIISRLLAASAPPKDEKATKPDPQKAKTRDR